MKKGETITIMVHRDSTPETRSIRVPVWAARAMSVAAGTLVVVILTAAALFTPIARTAARVPGLNREISRLRQENRQVTQLAATLAELEGRYDQVRAMLGIDIVPDRPPRIENVLPMARPILAAIPGETDPYDPNQATPVYWPLESFTFVTRGHSETGSGSGAHPGLDIAVPVETPIRASATGIVTEAGVDAEYGVYVRLIHVDDYETMYGHAMRVTVSVGDTVVAGQVIGLSGSTGRSTAPHLHFEVIKGGMSLDPGTVLREEI